MYDSLFSETDVGLNDYYIKDVGVYSNKLNFNIKINIKSHYFRIGIDLRIISNKFLYISLLNSTIKLSCLT